MAHQEQLGGGEGGTFFAASARSVVSRARPLLLVLGGEAASDGGEEAYGLWEGEGGGHGPHHAGDAAASELQSAVTARSRSTQWILRGSSLSCLQPGRCKNPAPKLLCSKIADFK